MPNQVADIKIFNEGIISNVDAIDTPSEAAVWSQNIDSQNSTGALKGCNSHELLAGTTKFTDGAFIEKTKDGDFKKVFIHTDGSNIKANYLNADYTSLGNEVLSLTDTSTALVSNATTFSTLNDTCYIGNGNNTPVWAGFYQNGKQFNPQVSFIQSGTGAKNDISADITKCETTLTKTFKVKITRAGEYTSLAIYNATTAQYDVNFNSTGLPKVGNRISYKYTRDDGVVSPEDFSGEVVITSNMIDTNIYLNLSSSGFTYTDLSYFIVRKEGETVPIDILTFTNNGEEPVYTNTSHTSKFLTLNEDIDLTDNVKIQFTSITGHELNSKWNIIVSPYIAAFVIENDKALKSPKFIDNLITILPNGLNNGFTYSASDSTFLAGKQLVYGISLVYDYLTETPIYTDSTMRFIVSSGTSNAKEHSIGLYISKTHLDFSKRITAVNLYFGIGVAGNELPDGYFRLLESFSIAPNEKFIFQDADTSYLIYTNTNRIKASYESNTGISQDLDNFLVNYTYSERIDAFNYISKCYHNELPNAERMVFKSKAYRFHTFDWTTDYITLDFIPTAMSSFRGKLFVYGDNKMVRINTDNFFIEETFNGIGCLNDKMITSNDYGIYWSDKNYAYQWDGQQVKKISLPIQNRLNEIEGTDELFFSHYSWSDFINNRNTTYSDTMKRFVVTDFSKRLIFFINTGWNTAFVWDIESQRWDYIIMPLTLTTGKTTNGVLTFPSGKVAFNSTGVDSTTTTEVLLNDSTTPKLFTYITKKNDLGSPGIKKSIKKFRMVTKNNTDDIAVYYRVDSGNWVQMSIPTTTEKHYEYNLSNLKAYTIQFKIVSTSGAPEVKNISIIYRTLRNS